jgi:hypothetical protein
MLPVQVVTQRGTLIRSKRSITGFIQCACWHRNQQAGAGVIRSHCMRVLIHFPHHRYTTSQTQCRSRKDVMRGLTMGLQYFSPCTCDRMEPVADSFQPSAGVSSRSSCLPSRWQQQLCMNSLE